jgi:hypothetical protein
MMDLIHTALIISACRGYTFQNDRIFYTVDWHWVSDELNPDHSVIIHIRRGELGPFQKLNKTYLTKHYPSTEKSIVFIQQALIDCDLKTYTVSEQETGKTITCHVCNFTSYHPKDVEYKYCARCKKFHYDIINQIQC